MASDISSIVAEYQFELDEKYGGGAWTVVDYSTEFEALWHGTYEHGIVMFWDGMPAGLNAAPVDIESNLTPYDWVLSFSRNLAQRGIETNFRVVIFDMTSEDIPTAFGVRMSSVLEANFPWLSICRSFENLHESIDQSCLRPVSVNDSEIIDLFAQIWINNLARSQDHHDINNLIAPQVLLEAMGRAVDAHLGRSTLMLHVRRLGLIETSNTEVDIEKWLARPRESISELEGSLRFILIDDQVDHGWAEVIAKFLGMEEQDPAPRSNPYSIERWSTEGKTELWTCSSASPLIDRLWADLRIDEQTDDMRHPKDLRFQLAFTGDVDSQDRGEAEHRQEVLLLDLRLGRSGGIDRTSLRRIAEIALVIDRRSSSDQNYVALVPSGGDWPQLGWLDAQWEEWLDTACSPETALHPMALGLLASVIAAIDLAYPIIIFSSTGQREIIEGFRGSPTILTDFEKPRILGSGSSEWLFNATLQWRDAVLQADDILHVRHVVQRAIRASLGTRRQAGTEMIRHVTIALDETGDFVENQGSAIGGVVIETTGETHLEAKIEAAKFMEHLRAFCGCRP